MVFMNERCAAAWTVGLSALALLLMAAGFAGLDRPVLESVRAGAGVAWKPAAQFLSRFGDFPFLLGAGVVALALFRRAGRRDRARIVVAMLLAGILAGFVSNATKLATGRVRPRVENVEHGWYGPQHEGRWVSLQHAFQAFPSSHAACAFGFFYPLFLSRRLAGAIGLLAAAAVAWSRVQLNAHHISDVAAGALIGVVVGWLVWRRIVARGGLSRWLGAA